MASTGVDMVEAGTKEVATVMDIAEVRTRYSAVCCG